MMGFYKLKVNNLLALLVRKQRAFRTMVPRGELLTALSIQKKVTILKFE